MTNVPLSQQPRLREPESGLEAVHASEYASYPEVYNYHQQGLEVAHKGHDQGLEVNPPGSHNYLYPVAGAPLDGSSPEVYSAVGGRDEKAPESTHVGQLAVSSQNKEAFWRRKRKTLVIVGVVVAVVVIAAAVVGGVLGAQAAESHGEAKTTSSSR